MFHLRKFENDSESAWRDCVHKFCVNLIYWKPTKWGDESSFIKPINHFHLCQLLTLLPCIYWDVSGMKFWSHIWGARGGLSCTALLRPIRWLDSLSKLCTAHLGPHLYWASMHEVAHFCALISWSIRHTYSLCSSVLPSCLTGSKEWRLRWLSQVTSLHNELAVNETHFLTQKNILNMQSKLFLENAEITNVGFEIKI